MNVITQLQNLNLEQFSNKGKSRKYTALNFPIPKYPLHIFQEYLKNWFVSTPYYWTPLNWDKIFAMTMSLYELNSYYGNNDSDIVIPGN